MMNTTTFRRTRARRPDMHRGEILQTVVNLRVLRDQCRHDVAEDGVGGVARGMAAGYHHAAHILWRDYLECNR